MAQQETPKGGSVWRFLLLFAVCRPLWAASYGPEFELLQHLQGIWQRHCYASLDGQTKIYREDQLVIDFTHFRFDSKVYLDNRCNAERTHYQGRVRYVLTPDFIDVTHSLGVMGDYPSKAYAINFHPDANFSAFFVLPMRNIVALQGDKLFLGRDYSGEAERGERLSKLDFTTPFIRQ